MSRHLPATRRVASALSAALLALGLAACQSQIAPTISDPKAILAAAATSTASATSVRLDVSANGALAVDLLGTGSGAPINLDGTTATADIDLAGQDARATFTLPGLLGIAGEVIAIDGTTYLKSTLTGPKYVVTQTADPGAAASETPDSLLAGLTDFLAQPELAPVKGDDVPCAGGTCYTVQIDLTADELTALAGDGVQLPTDLPIPLPDLGAATVQLTVRVEQSTTRLSGLTAVLGLGETGELTVELTFSKWNDAVSISAPPADEVAPGG